MGNLLPEVDLLIAALESLPIASFTADSRGMILSANGALLALTGYSHEELIGQPPTLLLNDTDVIAQSKAPWRGERMARRKTADPFPAELTISGIPNVGVLVTIQDVTDRKRVESSLSDAQRDFERFFNLIPELAVIASNDGHFKKINS